MQLRVRGRGRSLIYRTVQGDYVGHWIYARIGGRWLNGSGAAIGVELDGRLVAGLSYTQWTGPNVFASLAIEDRRAVNRSNLFLAFWYPFEQLRCKRITALVDEDNTASRSLLEHLGFTREATLVDAAPNGDQIVYRMLKEDCRWLSTLRRTHERRR